MRILLVEDNADDALLLRLALKKKGMCQSIGIVDGAEIAMDYLLGKGAYRDRRKHPLPELMLLDWRLPGMEGWEFLEWLRATDHFETLLVTVISGSQDLKDMQKAYRLGANFWVGKPQNMNELADVVRRIRDFWTQTATPVVNSEEWNVVHHQAEHRNGIREKFA